MRFSIKNIVLCLTFLLVLAGCSSGEKSIFELTRSDGTVKSFSLEEVRKLPTVTIPAFDKAQHGPTVKTVLKAAGVKKFKEVTITGSTGKTTLAVKDITPKVMLDITNRGTVKLVEPGKSKQEWVKDVSKIQVK